MQSSCSGTSLCVRGCLMTERGWHSRPCLAHYPPSNPLEAPSNTLWPREDNAERSGTRSCACHWAVLPMPRFGAQEGDVSSQRLLTSPQRASPKKSLRPLPEGTYASWCHAEAWGTARPSIRPQSHEKTGTLSASKKCSLNHFRDPTMV